MSDKHLWRALGILALFALIVTFGSTPAQAAPTGAWLPTFGTVGGPNGPVYAIAVRGSDVYVGGAFTSVGTPPVPDTSGIAKYSTQTKTWSNIDGITGQVNALAFKGSDLYVAGSFSEAGGTPMSNIAKWSTATETWSPLGTGIVGTVNALAVMGTDLYAGGLFTNAGGTPVNNLAKWDTKPGGTWADVGGGVQGTVNALAVKGKDLYVGGDFIMAGASTGANLIARWNARQQKWFALKGGLAGGTAVYALAFKGHDLYVGGDFEYEVVISGPQKDLPRIAKWSVPKKTWSPLGFGTAGGMSDIVRTLVVKGNTVYLGGSFPGVSWGMKMIQSYNLAAWSIPGKKYLPIAADGTGGPVQALKNAGSHVYVGGTFTALADSTPMPYLADYVAP